MAPFNSGAIESSEGLIGGIILKVESFLGRVKAWPDYQDQIIHVESIPARAPIYGALSEPLSPRLSKILSEMGIENLYSHQVSAIDAIRAGKDVTIFALAHATQDAAECGKGFIVLDRPNPINGIKREVSAL
ncbi:MAG TPA: hypothetical protein GX509_10585 [Firmicutes bacterium]|nr:hypothetical protein [Bacillota bacterium]